MSISLTGDHARSLTCLWKIRAVISLDPCVRRYRCSCFVSALCALPNSELHIKRCQAFKKVILKDGILINILYNDTYINKSCLSRVIFEHGPEIRMPIKTKLWKNSTTISASLALWASKTQLLKHAVKKKVPMYSLNCYYANTIYVKKNAIAKTWTSIFDLQWILASCIVHPA